MQALHKLAVLDTNAIPLDLLSADEDRVMVLLQKHLLVTVDGTGCAAKYCPKFFGEYIWEPRTI